MTLYVTIGSMGASNTRIPPTLDEVHLIEWNKRLNQSASMQLLEQNPNFLIRGLAHRRNQILYSLADWQGKIVADIGCEAGNLSRRIYRQTKTLYCVDIDETLLKLLKENLDIGAQDVRWIANNIENLRDIPSDAVDITVSGCVLPHVPSPEKALSELVRISRNQGIIILNSTHDTFNLKVKRIVKALGLSALFPHIQMGLAPGHLHEASLPFHLTLIERMTPLQIQRKFLAPLGTFIFIVCKVEKK